MCCIGLSVRDTGMRHMKRLGHVRLLMYSHDTFGLGHLRRCQTIAHSLVENFRGLHILIVSGSAIAGAFDFRARVDFVKIPSVTKLPNGDYTSKDRHIDIAQTLKMRTDMIRDTAKSFDPDFCIVDKEPMGLRGELEDTLSYLKTRGCTLILGLRDVLDSAHLLKKEWARRDTVRKVEAIYDDIWVYGPRGFWNPLTGLDITPELEARLIYTGFLRRSIPRSFASVPRDRAPFTLVTTGGGGDGVALMRNVLAAFELEPATDHNAVLVLGPFMPPEHRQEINNRAAALNNIAVVEFNNRMEQLMSDADAVVGMCGYNTFCEILSFNKRALMVPRISPREEQLVRANRAKELDLMDMIHPDDACSPARMLRALKAVKSRALPDERDCGAMLNGLDVIAGRMEHLTVGHAHTRLKLIKSAV